MLWGVDQGWEKREGIDVQGLGRGGWGIVRGDRRLVACTIRNSHLGLESGVGGRHSIRVSPMSGALMYQAWNCLFICQQSSCLNYRREKCLLECACERGQEAVFSEGLLAEITGSGEDSKGRSWASLREARGGMARGPPATLGGPHCWLLVCRAGPGL